MWSIGRDVFVKIIGTPRADKKSNAGRQSPSLRVDGLATQVSGLPASRLVQFT